MNFLDVDFPEVTEAYKGSLEDWLELFERYAFPKTGDTETSIEMKRIFKRYPEVTYEDWLDSVIKSVRDELWYEEKINLSIREFYLVVNKVAGLDKKLRATYNRLTDCNLIENTGAIDTQKFSDNLVSASESNTPTEISFTDLYKRCANFNFENPAVEDITFWKAIRDLIRSKKTRLNYKIQFWVDRLVDSFIKPALVEIIIKDLLNRDIKDLLNRDFTIICQKPGNEFTLSLRLADTDFYDLNQGKIYRDKEPEKIKADYHTTLSITYNNQEILKQEMALIDCKSVSGIKSDAHGAILLAVYEANYSTNSGYFYLKATELFSQMLRDAAKQLADKTLSEKLQQVVYTDLIIYFGSTAVAKNSICRFDDTSLWNDAFAKLLDTSDIVDLNSFKNKLKCIDDLLYKEHNSSDKKMTNYLHKQANALLAQAQKLGATTKPLASTSKAKPETAANSLKKAAQTLASEVLVATPEELDQLADYQ